MLKIEKEFQKYRKDINLDYVEKFILKSLKKEVFKQTTVSTLLNNLDISPEYFKDVARFISEEKKSFGVEFQGRLDNIYLKN